MTGEPDRCRRPVEIDGETIETARPHLAALVRAVKQRAAEICTCGHLKGEHRIDLQRQYCATGAEIPGYACEQKCQHYTPRGGT